EMRPNAVSRGAMRSDRGHGKTFEAGTKWTVSRCRRSQLRQMRAHIAVVSDGLARARAAGENEGMGEAEVEEHIDAVEVLTPRSILRRVGDQVADLTSLVRDDVEEIRNDVPAAPGQSRVGWRDEAERCQVGRFERQIVGNEEAVVPTPAVGHIQRGP